MRHSILLIGNLILFSMVNNTSTLLACHACDLLVEVTEHGVGLRNRCPRCATVIMQPKGNSAIRVLALSITGLLLSYPAFFWPIMTLNAMGQNVQGSLFDAVVSFIHAKYYFVAVMVLLTSILFPLLRFILCAVLAAFLQTAKPPPFLLSWLRTALHLEEWAMLDVYILGIGVTLIKVHGMAEVQFNLALFCLLAVCVCSLMISAFFDREQFWAGLTGKPLSNPEIVTHSSPSETAREAGLLVCHHCHCLEVSVTIGKDERQLCQRCNAPVHQRNNHAVANTWALLIVAVILFIPANVLPIMRVYFMGVPDESTIMDGIIYFFQHGSIGIGLIILTASIIVPLFKMVGLVILLVNIQFNRKIGLVARTKMFHFIEFIGRWSMLDIFVIGLMAILISFGNFTAIVAAPAATYFCLVVVTTMLAASTFDSRLLWDESTPCLKKQP